MMDLVDLVDAVDMVDMVDAVELAGKKFGSGRRIIQSLQILTKHSPQMTL